MPALENALKAARGQRDHVLLHLFEIRHIELAAREHFADPLVAEGQGPFVAEGNAVAGRQDVVIRRSDEMRGWIVEQRQFRHFAEAAPFELARAWYGEQAGPVLADRRHAGGVPADVAVYVGVDDVLAGHFVAFDSGAELLPVAGARQRQAG